MSEPPPPRTPAATAWLTSAAVALACLAFLAFSGSGLARRLSVTADEPGHLGAGLGYWQAGDYRQSTANMFFTQKWAALPLHLAGRQLPGEDAQRELRWNPTWIGEALLFSGDGDPRAVLAPARMMTLALCLLGGALVWGWASRLSGPWAGALATLLYAASPVVLANGVLVTTDMGAALWYAAATACYGWMLRRPSALAASLTGACAALLALSKLSVLTWLLGAALLLGWRVRRRGDRPRVPALLAWHALAGLVAWGCVWAFFGWQFRPGGFVYFDIRPSTPTEHLVCLLDRMRALPEPFLREFLSLGGLVRPRPGYLLGEFRMGGFWYYFPVAFLAKSTLGMLLALASWLAVRRMAAAPGGDGFSPLVAGALGYGAVALLTPLNIGVRHILPLYLFAAVAGGVALARMARRGAAWRGLAAALALLGAAEGFSARRQPLAWFNALWGGPMSGYRTMVDSSLEWGGDLPELWAWEKGLRARDPATPVFVSLLGPPGNEHFGLPAAEMGNAFETGIVRPGYFIFSATRLEGGPPELYGAWNDTLEQAWRAYGAAAWRQPLPHRLAQLAVARLAASCRGLEPAERVGPAYFVYHLDEGALEAAMGKAAGR